MCTQLRPRDHQFVLGMHQITEQQAAFPFGDPPQFSMVRV